MNSHFKYLIVSLLVFLTYFPVQGKLPEYTESRKLESLDKSLKSQFGVSTTSDLSDFTIYGRKLVYSHNNQQVLTHLGIYLFPVKLRIAVGNEMAEFLERIILESILEEHNEKLASKLKEYNMSLEWNQVSYGSSLSWSLATGLDAIRDQSRFSLSQDTLHYCAQWLNGDNSSFEIRFPANYELILGKDKKELDDQLGASLINFSCNGEKSISPLPAVNELEKGQYFSTLSGKYLFIKDMNTNTYFTQSPTGEIKWLYDEHYPDKTLTNLFHHEDKRADDIKLRILHRKYGKKTDEYQISLSQLIGFFNEGYETYVGFEQNGETELTAVVFFYNTAAKYLNMLRVKTKSDAIFGKGTMNAELHSYIPEHNIKNLFGEYRDSGKLFPVKL